MRGGCPLHLRTQGFAEGGDETCHQSDASRRDVLSRKGFAGINYVAGWVVQCDAVWVSVECRLAPEHRDPAALERGRGGLQSFGIDLNRLMVSGQAAGATLAAGLALLVRDHCRPKICAQLPCHTSRYQDTVGVGEADVTLIGNVRVGDGI